MIIDPLEKYPSLIARNGSFRDAHGRQVILHGINLVDKNPQGNYARFQDPMLFNQVRDWGFNVIRLGVIWDGLEPEPGTINEAYLQHLDHQIACAKAAGLYVFLDMHQDLYSVLYSDGAPAWATLTNDLPHVDLGGVWSDAYFTSPAVQAALDNFWKDAPAPDGIGLQSHYARVWQALARRFAGEPTVIGYDLMNEPFPGSAAAASQELLFQQAAEVLAMLDNALTPENLAMQWLDPAQRGSVLSKLNNPQIFSNIIDVTHPIYAAFEQGSLQGLFTRVSQAIREADPHHLLFLETSMGSNMGVYSAIEPVMLAGQRDPQQVYAPHGYDLVVDTPGIAASSPERVKLIFSRHQETANRHNWPMLVGEWGAYGFNPGTLPAAQTVVSLFEQLLCSETYWAYQENLEEAPCFEALNRPYPERVAGALRSYRTDWQAKTFTCSWQEESGITVPSWFYLPRWLAASPGQIKVSPAGEGFSLKPAGTAGAWLCIPPCGQAGSRNLVVQE